MATRPLGGGIGSAGSWGARFSPGTFLANFQLDSWYVKIWAESGIVGLTIYLGMILFILINRFYALFMIKDQELKLKLSALYAGVFGICFASYGNQIFGQDAAPNRLCAMTKRLSKTFAFKMFTSKEATQVNHCR